MSKDWKFKTKRYEVEYFEQELVQGTFKLCCIYLKNGAVPFATASTIADDSTLTRSQIIHLALERATGEIIKRKFTQLLAR